MERRQRHTRRITKDTPDRRKLLFDRRQHSGVFRIFFIPWSRLCREFFDVQIF
jgi:hypothetical protein